LTMEGMVATTAAVATSVAAVATLVEVRPWYSSHEFCIVGGATVPTRSFTTPSISLDKTMMLAQVAETSLQTCDDRSELPVLPPPMMFRV
ncbi:MAG: hypothetical protein SGPRY_010631, partial [Prymnesium sp.]